jgi:membrane protein involved in colicin uptake
MQVLWLRFLTEINDETREVPAELLENAEVSEALEIVERAAFDDGEMRAYDKFWDNVSVLKTLENARKREIEAAEKAKAEAEKAKAEAEKTKAEAEKTKAEAEKAKDEAEKAKDEAEKAKDEAEKAKDEAEKAKDEAEEAKAKLKQEKLDTARKMKSKGFAIEDIAEITSLTIEQIEAL